MIITIKQLQVIHYYYFIMGIFSVVNAFFTGFGSFLSMVFIGFYISNSVVSWYIANAARNRMKEYVIVQSLGYFIRHVVVTLATVSAAVALWASGTIPDTDILRSLLMANYMVMFFAGIWYILTRTGFVRGLFTIYDNRVFRRSKEFIIRIRKAYWNFFEREIVTEHDIMEYRYGTIREVDSNMVSAWKNRKEVQYVLECLGRIEMSLARQIVGILRDKLEFLRSREPDPGNKRMISRAEDEIAGKLADISEYEKVFYRKTGESEFLKL